MPDPVIPPAVILAQAYLPEGTNQAGEILCRK